MQINDLSHLDPREVNQRVRYVIFKIWYDQYKANWFIKDVRSDVYLRNEIRAYLEGRIQEFHGWTDIVGQIVDPIIKGVTGWITDFWTDTMEPGIRAIFADWSDIWNDTKDYVLKNFNNLKDLIETSSDIYSWLTQTASQYLQDIYDYVSAIGDTVKSVLDDSLSTLQDYIKTKIDDLGSSITDTYQSLQNTLTESWNSLVESVSGQLEAITKGMDALPQSIAAGFNSAISYLWELILSARQQADKVAILVKEDVVVPVWDALVWVREWLRDQITGIINSIFTTVTEKSKEIQKGDIKAALELLGTPLLLGAGIASLVSVLGTKIMGTGIEVGEIGNYINRAISIETFTNAFLYPLLDTAVRSPLWQVFNKQFTPRIPDIWDAIKMHWRGIITKEELEEIIKRLGYGGKYLEGYLEFVNQIPSASDLVRFVVRECFPLEELPPAPEEFVKYMAKQGYNELWSRAYWEAHWQLPSFEQLQKALFRGIISEEEFKKYIVWHDYKPTKRPGINKSDVEIVNAIMYNLPGKLDARWMLRWGIITKEEMAELVKMEGYHPDWIKKIAEAEYWNMLLDERTAVKSALESLYLQGSISQEILREKLKEIKFLDDEINYLVQRANYRLQEKIVEMSIDAYTAALRNDKITIQEYAAKLSELGLRDEIVQALVAIEQARMREPKQQNTEDQVRAIGYSIAIRRFKEGMTTISELEQELRMLGYTEDRIKQFKILAQLERDYDYAMEVLSTVKSAYKRGKIGDEMFINILRQFGFTDEKIQLELSLLKLYLGYFGYEEGESA